MDAQASIPSCNSSSRSVNLFPPPCGDFTKGALKDGSLRKLKPGEKSHHFTEDKFICSYSKTEKRRLCFVYFSTSPTSLQAYHFPCVTDSG